MGKTRDMGNMLTPEQKTIIIPSANSAENISFFYTQNPITITEIRSTVKGTTPSVTFSVRHGTDRSAARRRIMIVS